MTAPHGQVPLAETSPNGRHPAGSRARLPGPGPEPPGPEHRVLTESAVHLAGGAEAALGPGPLTGFGLRHAAGILRTAGRQAVREPQALLRGASGAGRELLRVARGKSEVAPDKGDKRFADPAWRENPVYRAVMQTYL
jgi:hypothetical protein